MSHAHPEDSSIVIHRSGFYDFFAGRFVRRSDGAILARAGVGPGDRVLDVGTGPGYLALAASRLVGPEGAAVGIDASPEMIDRARMLAARAGARAEYQVASAESLPFEDGSFDVAVSRLVLHHLPGDLKTAGAARDAARAAAGRAAARRRHGLARGERARITSRRTCSARIRTPRTPSSAWSGTRASGRSPPAG